MNAKQPPRAAALPKLRVRPLTWADLDEVVELNKIAYPTMAEDNVVWKRKHVESHLQVFPEGQVVALSGDRIVGAASSLIVSLGKDPLRDHTWNGITDSGYFKNHIADGDTLYGADVCTHPDYRGRGVGAALYEARRQLCRKLNLRRIVLGGRLYGYGRHASHLSADEYARRVEAGELKDLVLSFQLREGFTLRKVMANYLLDRRSRNYASFLEWINPDYKPRGPGRRRVRVTVVQYCMRKIQSFDDFEREVTYFVDVASDYKSDFVLFPELLSAQLMSFLTVKTPREAIRKLTTYTERLERMFSALARKYQVSIIGGSHPTRVGDHIENISTVYLPTGASFRQSKLHITPNERRWWGIDGGSELRVIQTPQAKIGVLICYDSEFPEAARRLADQGAEILFVPFCTDDRQGYLRVRYCCAARAVENQLYVALAGTVGNLPDTHNMDVQYAQSAVLSPSDFSFGRDGIVAEASPNTEMVLTTDLDLDLLTEAVHGGTVTPRLDRRPDLYKSWSTSAG